jgi:hypothetical protein
MMMMLLMKAVRIWLLRVLPQNSYTERRGKNHGFIMHIQQDIKKLEGGMNG